MFRRVDSFGSLEISCTDFRQAAVRGAAFILAILLGSIQASGQDVHIVPHANTSPPGIRAIDSPPAYSNSFQVKVDLVLVPVAVTDSFGRLVTGLGKENFEIYEGKDKQAIRTFSSEDSPVSIGIIFDTSGSMTDKIERAREAVAQLLETANPEDEFFLITFADSPNLVTDFTDSSNDLQNRLLSVTPRGSTALLDAIYLGISKMRQAQYARKALLIISDGGDNHSRYREHEIKSLVREADTLVYAIGIYDRYFSTIEEQIGPALLGEISQETGGRMFSVDNPKDIPDIAAKIGIELRNQYVVGYRPLSPKIDGKWHKIKVKLSLPKGLPRCEIHAKQGYYAPSQ
jgi:Ca-activated chloride channel family protein